MCGRALKEYDLPARLQTAYSAEDFGQKPTRGGMPFMLSRNESE